jgi:DNA-binding CsgD family transcriptional regulator
MKKRKRQSYGKIINWQRTHVNDVGANRYTGESSPYWEWVSHHAEQNEDGEFKELSQANPDVLEDYDVYEQKRHYYHQVIEEGYVVLSPREKQVFNMLASGHSEDKIAERLNIKRTSVKDYRERIKNKFFKLVDIDA